MDLKEAIRALRGKETQQAFATRLGLSISGLQLWEGQRERRYEVVRKKEHPGNLDVLFVFFRESYRASKWDIYDLILAEIMQRTAHSVPGWQIEAMAVSMSESEAFIVVQVLDYLRSREGKNPDNPILQLLRNYAPVLDNMHPRRREALLKYIN